MRPCQGCGSSCLGRFVWRRLAVEARVVLCLDCFAVEVRGDEEGSSEQAQTAA
jgi:hypothetical protein